MKCSYCGEEFKPLEPESPITLGGTYGSYEIRWVEGQPKRIAAYCEDHIARAMLPFGHPDSLYNEKKDDWLFDVGFDANGRLMVEVYSSSIPDRRFKGISRAALVALRILIEEALRDYPSPIQPYPDEGQRSRLMRSSPISAQTSPGEYPGRRRR